MKDGMSQLQENLEPNDPVSLLRNAKISGRGVWWVNEHPNYVRKSPQDRIVSDCEIKSGDIIIYYVPDEIREIGRVTEAPDQEKGEDGKVAWQPDPGLYFKLDKPLQLGKIDIKLRRSATQPSQSQPLEFSETGPQQEPLPILSEDGPFDSYGKVKKGDCFRCSQALVKELANLLSPESVRTARSASTTPAQDVSVNATTAKKDIHLAPTKDEIIKETGLKSDLLTRWLNSLDRKGQAILYGPPGTGKTFTADLIARHLVGGGDGLYETVQFHPAYAYEDFIQGLRPKLNDHGQLDYRLEPGRFLDFVHRARTRHGTSVLVIDEINRADLARVFGELMYLLEYRDQKAPLAGGGEEKFFIPENVRIIGTMNTADRSVTLIDHALRRRFAFWRLEPDYTFLRDYHQHTPAAPWIADLVTVLEEVNRSIDNPDRSLGTSFFLTKTLDLDTTADIWQTEIEPYLEEIFFDRPDAIVPFRWERVSEQLGLNDDSSG